MSQEYVSREYEFSLFLTIDLAQTDFSPYALDEIYLPDPAFAEMVDREILDRYMHVGGVRIEDDILITAKGHENLTLAPKGREMLDIIRDGAKCKHGDDCCLRSRTNQG